MSIRYERVDFAESDLAKPQKTSDGFWKLEGKAARVGIQEYRKADGTVVRELRLPEDVKASAQGFALLPLTNGHPPGMVTPENAKQYAVGAVGHADFAEGWIKAPMTVWSKDAIDSIRAGRVQLSVGYQCTLLEEPGEWNGQRYDCRQTEIIPNHLALVDVARAGNQARLRLDSNSAVALDCIHSMSAQPENPMHKFAVDGLTIEVSDANHQAIVERALEKQVKRADEAEKALGEAKKQAADLATELEVYKAKVKEHADSAATFDARIAEAVEKIAALGAEVSRHGVDTSKLKPTEAAYHAAALAKLSPKLKLDGMDASQLATAYKTAVAMVADAPSAADNARAGVGTEQKNDGPSRNAEDARRKYNERLFGGSK